MKLMKVLSPRTACALLLISLVAGCAGAPTLADARLTEVAAATQAEVQAMEAAQNIYIEQQKPRVRLNVKVIQPDWPWLWVTFESSRQLFDPLEAGQRGSVVYICSLAASDSDIPPLAFNTILWRGRIVGQEAAREIAQELKASPTPQEYKVFFRYQNWDHREPRAEGDPITLSALQEDLCLSLKKERYPLPPSIGDPLRIDKDAVNTAVGKLPRPLAVPKL